MTVHAARGSREVIASSAARNVLFSAFVPTVTRVASGWPHPACERTATPCARSAAANPVASPTRTHRRGERGGERRHPVERVAGGGRDGRAERRRDERGGTVRALVARERHGGRLGAATGNVGGDSSEVGGGGGVHRRLGCAPPLRNGRAEAADAGAERSNLYFSGCGVPLGAPARGDRCARIPARAAPGMRAHEGVVAGHRGLRRRRGNASEPTRRADDAGFRLARSPGGVAVPARRGLPAASAFTARSQVRPVFRGAVTPIRMLFLSLAYASPLHPTRTIELDTFAVDEPVNAVIADFNGAMETCSCPRT